MNLKRALGIGVLTYIASAIIGNLVLYLYDINSASAQFPDYIIYINIVITLGLAALFSLWYFNDKKVEDNAKEGFYFGIVFVIVGVILDAILFMVGAKYISTQIDIKAYYLNPTFVTAIILFLVITTLVGWIKGHYKRRKSRLIRKR